MTRLLRRAIAGLGITLAAVSWPVSPAAAAASHHATVRPAAQAWYWTVGCTTAVGCGVFAPPIDPFPAGALHVGVIGGVQIATAYLGFGDKALPAGAESSRATLTLPLASDPAAAVVNPASAQLEVCTTDELITSADYALSTPPPANCAHGVMAKYHGGATPSFTVDLLPLLGGHPSLAGRTLALLPAAKPALQTWQLAFNAKPADKLTSLIRASVTYRLRAVRQPSGPVGPVAGAPPVAPLAAPPVPPIPDVGATVAPLPGDAGAPIVAPTRIAAQTRLIKGGRYGMVWAVPLGLLLLGWLIGSTATKDLRSLRRD